MHEAVATYIPLLRIYQQILKITNFYLKTAEGTTVLSEARRPTAEKEKDNEKLKG
jgi:hypothetical protein